jgi:hypothetical protein
VAPGADRRLRAGRPAVGAADASVIDGWLVEEALRALTPQHRLVIV